MSYRQPAPREKRLWFVYVAYNDIRGRAAGSWDWVWALEGDEALAAFEDRLRMSKDGHANTWSYQVICGEDFAEREAKGPPKRAETPKPAETT